MIRMVVENAHAEGIWAGICGELGADLSLTKEFLKMGVDELSVSPGRVRRFGRSLSKAAAVDKNIKTERSEKLS